MDCDRDMVLIPKKEQRNYRKIVTKLTEKQESSLVHLQLFDQTMVKDWVNFFDNNGHYKKTLTVQTRPIKEIRIEEAHPKTL